MRSLAELETALAAPGPAVSPGETAPRLLAMAEEVLEQWIIARGETPTFAESEGFRLLALHRQGAKGVPSFNACRETCREIAYHCNLLRTESAHPEAEKLARMLVLLVKHLLLFVQGKLEVEGLGDFCCASRPLRLESSG